MYVGLTTFFRAPSPVTFANNSLALQSCMQLTWLDWSAHLFIIIWTAVSCHALASFNTLWDITLGLHTQQFIWICSGIFVYLLLVKVIYGLLYSSCFIVVCAQTADLIPACSSHKILLQTVAWATLTQGVVICVIFVPFWLAMSQQLKLSLDLFRRHELLLWNSKCPSYWRI